MNLVIDIGNSATKAALFNDREMIRSTRFTGAGIAEVSSLLAGSRPDFTILSSVKPGTPLESWLQPSSHFIRFHSGLKSMIRNKYKTPETLGPDRLAAVIGAAAKYPGKDVLVIDAGTCITYDLLDRDLNYWGGSISPGVAMRFSALHEYTGKLPLIALNEHFDEVYGNDTQTAILAGVQQGIVYELIGQIGAFASRYPGILVVLCGGSAGFFESRLKNSIFAPIVNTEPDLVLTGLNEVISQYND